MGGGARYLCSHAWQVFIIRFYCCNEHKSLCGQGLWFFTCNLLMVGLWAGLRRDKRLHLLWGHTAGTPTPPRRYCCFKWTVCYTDCILYDMICGWAVLYWCFFPNKWHAVATVLTMTTSLWLGLSHSIISSEGAQSSSVMSLFVYAATTAIIIHADLLNLSQYTVN